MSDKKEESKIDKSDKDKSKHDLKGDSSLHITSQDPLLAIPLIANFILFSTLLQSKIHLNENVNESSILTATNSSLGELQHFDFVRVMVKKLYFIRMIVT